MLKIFAQVVFQQKIAIAMDIMAGYNLNKIWRCRWPSEEKDQSKINFSWLNKIHIILYLLYIYIRLLCYN